MYAWGKSTERTARSVSAMIQRQTEKARHTQREVRWGEGIGERERGVAERGVGQQGKQNAKAGCTSIRTIIMFIFQRRRSSDSPPMRYVRLCECACAHERAHAELELVPVVWNAMLVVVVIMKMAITEYISEELQHKLTS